MHASEKGGENFSLSDTGKCDHEWVAPRSPVPLVNDPVPLKLTAVTWLISPGCLIDSSENGLEQQQLIGGKSTGKDVWDR